MKQPQYNAETESATQEDGDIFAKAIPLPMNCLQSLLESEMDGE